MSHMAADEPKEIALLDSAMTHTILNNPEYFEFKDVDKNPA